MIWECIGGRPILLWRGYHAIIVGSKIITGDLRFHLDISEIWPDGYHWIESHLCLSLGDATIIAEHFMQERTMA